MTVIRLCLDDLSLRVASCAQVSSENVKTIGIELRRNNRWLDYTMSAVFFTSWSKTVYEVMLEGDSCIVPHEVLDKPGKLYIGIRGVKDDLVKASTLVVYKIEKGAPTGTATAMEPTPDVYQQILKRLDEIDLGVPDAQIEEAVRKYLENNPVNVVVDDALSEESENPVQNKVITKEVTEIKVEVKNIKTNIGEAKAVLYSEQSLTDAQKTQARTNIGAASAAEVSKLSDQIDDLPSGGGMSSNAKELLIKILRNGMYTSDQSQNITDLATALETSEGGGSEEPDTPDEPTLTTYTITSELVNVTSNNSATSVNEGASYTATLTAVDGYTLDSVSVLMGGTDITATAYADGVITIASVTGNVEIVASAVIEKSDPALITDGLVFDYDLRNVSLESYNLTGWGAVYKTVDKTNTALLFGGSQVTGNDYGLDCDNVRGNRLISDETQNVKLGTAYTVQAYYSRKDSSTYFKPSLFGWGTGTNIAGRISMSPKYLVDGSETVVTTYHGEGFDDTARYMLVTYVVDKNLLTMYVNGTRYNTWDGNEFENFDQWVDYGAPKTVYAVGLTVAFVGYNRVLSESEIVENYEYFRTMEVV